MAGLPMRALGCRAQMGDGLAVLGDGHVLALLGLADKPRQWSFASAME
jgi:hypothetical protein